MNYAEHPDLLYEKFSKALKLRRQKKYTEADKIFNMIRKLGWKYSPKWQLGKWDKDYKNIISNSPGLMIQIYKNGDGVLEGILDGGKKPDVRVFYAENE